MGEIRELCKKMFCVCKEQFNEVFRFVKFKCKLMQKGYRRWIQRFIRNFKRGFFFIWGMEESFEEVMILNLVLKDGGKFVMLKKRERSYLKKREG